MGGYGGNDFGGGGGDLGGYNMNGLGGLGSLDSGLEPPPGSENWTAAQWAGWNQQSPEEQAFWSGQ
jgi:hypothetical protein